MNTFCWIFLGYLSNAYNINTLHPPSIITYKKEAKGLQGMDHRFLNTTMEEEVSMEILQKNNMKMDLMKKLKSERVSQIEKLKSWETHNKDRMDIYSLEITASNLFKDWEFTM